MQVMREKWEETCYKRTDVSTYRQELLNQLNIAWQVAKGTLEEAQQCHKAVYDQRAREHEFQVGDRVLVLLPMMDNKLLTQWEGLFEIIQRAGPIDYSLLREHQIFHVNLSRAWKDSEGWLATPEEISLDQSSQVERGEEFFNRIDTVGRGLNG